MAGAFLAMPAPAGAQAAAPVTCPIEVSSVFRVDRAGTTYGFVLSTPLATQTAGGRITVYAGSSRYVLPFENATVAGAGEGQRARPVFYRFAAPTPVESAYVSWLDGSDSGPCDPFEPWEAALHPSPRLASDPDASVLAKPAPPPEPAEPVSCAAPSVPSGVTTYATVYRPPVAAPKGSAVTVKVILDTRGAVVSATVQNSDDPGLDATAIDAAQRTIFHPRIYRCRPAGGAYLFIVQF